MFVRVRRRRVWTYLARRTRREVREVEPPWGGQGVSGTTELLSIRDWAGSSRVEVGEPASGDIPGVRPSVDPANGP